MSEATRIITALSEEFDRAVIQTKPGSKPGAPYKPATKFVSHGSVTKRLNAVCPGWSSRVVEWHTYIDAKQELRCAGVTLEITVPNAGSHHEFGTSASHRSFGDDAKNAISDALKRCAMRFGVAIDLWEDLDEADDDVLPQSPAARYIEAPRPVQQATEAPPKIPPAPLTDAQEKTIAGIRDEAEAGLSYAGAGKKIRDMEADATPGQWVTIKQRFLAIRKQFYPDTLKAKTEGAK